MNKLSCHLKHALFAPTIRNSESIKRLPPDVAGPQVYFIEAYEKFGSSIFFKILNFFGLILLPDCVVSQVVQSYSLPQFFF